ncbi:MAG: hypothetical protein GY903_15485 [Fuerstiella sp.]|nr:hypothetical protein [Fuerstiella sp.]MCP4855884.1 hypothetical protein [Fuerstiella sp.]
MKTRYLAAVIGTVSGLLSVGFASTVLAQPENRFEPPENVSFRHASIVSEGTRMSAEVFLPKGAKQKLPTIVMSHGWGGTAEHLRTDGVAFARAGFLVVTFDFRGWGNSEARVITKSSPVERDGKTVAEVTEVRGVVDPIYNEKRKEAQQLTIDWFREHVTRDAKKTSAIKGQR